MPSATRAATRAAPVTTPADSAATRAATAPYDVVWQGDALERLRTLPAASVDCILTDPPYSSGTRREAAKGLRKSMTRGKADAEWFGADSLTVLGFGWLLRTCAVEWQRVLKPGGHALIFIDWRMLPHLVGAVESADLRHAGVLVWDKTYFGMGSCFRNQHEMILHFTNGVGTPPRRHDVGNVLACKPIRNGCHPTEKPVDLLRTLLSVVCPANGLVLDCFAGSGSTLVAAQQEGMHFLGIEREVEYVSLTRARLGLPVPERQHRAPITPLPTLWDQWDVSVSA